MVVDDSVLFRRVMTEVLASFPGLEVVGSASNGKIALSRLAEWRPDLITLDMEMPELDGLAVLDAIRKLGSPAEVIVVSAVTRQGGQLTMRALEKGAFDFITKPDTADAEQSRQCIRRDLEPRLRALARRLEIRNILGNRSAPVAPPKVAPDNLEGIAGRMSRLVTPGKPELVLIGVSTGGPAALARILPDLPANLGVPVVIVQHMPPIFTQSLAESLAAKCAIDVREASQGEVLEANTAYIAPGGKQMRLSLADNRKILQITDDPPENNCKPAVDYLFRSAANLFPGRSTAVILTGMGSDGTIGLKLLKRNGCFVIAQDEATCVVYGMSKTAVDAGVADVVLPVQAIAGKIMATVRGW
jgi:two-component system, chemotaxis family, protein-glutamate methylesterase/glutaminase